MPSNAFVALGGIADGLGRSLQRKQDQQHDDAQKHQDLVNNLVSAGISSGKVTDPEQAFKFLMNGGKPGGKDLPPAVGDLIQSVMAHHNATPGANTTQPALPGAPSAGSTGGDPTGGSGPSATSLIGTGTGADSGTGAPAPAASPDQGTGTGTASPAPQAQAPTQTPTQSSNPMGGFKTTDQLSDEEVARRGRDTAATDMAKYNSQVAVARRMVQTGGAATLRDAFQMLGIGRQLPIAGLAPKNIALPIASTDVPEGALTTGGDPFDAGTAKFAQKTQVHVGWNADGTPRWETRYDPSGAPNAVTAAGSRAAVDPAKFRERLAEIKAATPGISDDDARKQAGDSLQQEAATTASIAKTRDQTAGEAAGTKAGPYDDLPTVLQDAQGRADPESQAAFVAALKAKPKGNILANNIQQASQYKMPSTDFTSRQIGGLNRATFVGLVKQFDPTFDETKYKPRQEMMTSWRGDGKTAQTMASAKKIVNHLGELNQASTEMDKVSSNFAGGIMNEGYVGAKRILGDKKTAEQSQAALAHFKTATDVLALELRRFFATAGSGSQQEVADWQKLANPYGTTTERKTFLHTAAKMMLGQVVPKVQQYQETVGDLPPGSQWLDNKDRIRLRSMGVDISDLPPLPENANKTVDPAEAGLPPEIQGLAPGMKATLPDGRIFYRDANGVLRGGTTVAPKAPKK